MEFKELALAKLCLTLRILNKREDGYNNIDALTLYCQDYFDTIEMDFSDTDSKLTLNPNSQIEKDLDLKNNLVLDALSIYENKLSDFDIEKYLFLITLTKTIPAGAGLGGGSADCAATLRLLNKIYKNIFDINELVSMASTLGSDIPGCIYSKALIMTGRGEEINLVDRLNPRLEFLKNFRATIITPNIFSPTPTVYKFYDEIGRPTHVGIEAPEEFGILSDNFHNDLEIAALKQFPELNDFKTYIEKICGVTFLLAGSGSSFFVIQDLEHSDAIEKSLKDEFLNSSKHEKIRQLCSSVLC